MTIFTSFVVNQHRRFAQALIVLYSECSVTPLLYLLMTNHASLWHLALPCESCQLHAIICRETESALRDLNPDPL